MALTRQVSDYKDSVKAATVGANINLAAAPNTLDGVSLSVGDRILVKDQTPNTLNGIYRITTLGTGSNGLWTRTGDFNDWRTITSGALTFVEQGAISGNIFYYIPGGEPNVTVGSTAITFANLYTLIDTTAPLQSVTNYGNITTNPITAASFTTNSGGQHIGYLTGAIGANTPNTIVATSVTTSSGGQLTGYLTGAIGANTANTGNFTTITTSGSGGNITGTNTGYIISGYLVANNNVYGNSYLWYNNNAPLATTITGTYSNSNVASYLPTFNGNLTASTVTLSGAANSYGSGQGALQIAGGFYAGGDSFIAGNLVVANLTSLGSTSLVANAPLLYLEASGISTYNYEIGFYSHKYDAVEGYNHTGLVRNHIDNAWYLFSNIRTEPGLTVDLSNANIVYDTIKVGNAIVYGNIVGGYFTGAIGANTPNTGTFTTVTATTAIHGTISANSFTGYFTGAIGANTANTGNFTTVVAASGTNSTSSTTGALVVNGGAGISGNLYVASTVVLGTPLTYTPANGFLQIGSNINNYVQVAIQNANNGTNASTDIAAVANNGSDNDTYVDMGITSSTYNQAPYNLYGANDGYLIVSGNTTTQGGNLILNTYTAKDIVFATGGTLKGNEIGRFRANTNSFVISSGTNSTSISTGALQVVGGAGISGNLYVGSNIYVGGTAVGKFYTGNTAPSGPNLGDRWYQGNADILFEYIQDAANNKFWLDLTSNPSSYGNLTVANTLTLNGTTNNNGTINLGSTSQVTLTGGSSGYVLSTNGSGALSWIPVSATSGGANTMVQFNNGGVTAGTTYLQYNLTSGNLVSNSTTTSTSTTTGALVLAGGLGVGGNIYASNLNLISTTASAITTVLTRGSDVNFQLSAQNGSSSNATGAETARFGINYSGIGWDSFIQFIRGGSSQNGALALWAANTPVANVASTSIYPVSNNSITLGTASGQYFSAIYANNYNGSNFNGINVVTTGNIYSGGNIVAASGTTSTSTTTGALVVTGGAGIGGNIFSGGYITANGSFSETTTVPGAYIGNVNSTPRIALVNGNSSVTWEIDNSLGSFRIFNPNNLRLTIDYFGNLFLPGAMSITNTSVSTSTTTGAFTVSGGAGIAGALYVGNIVTTNGIFYPNGATAGGGGGGSGTPGGANTMIQFNDAGTFSGATYIQYNKTSGNLVSNSTTQSTSTTTGALVVNGGIGINANAYVGGNIYTQQRQGFTYSGNNTSVAYTYYNATTGSLDTVFG